MPKLTERDVADRSYWNKEAIDRSVARALKYLTDPEKVKRIRACMCVRCYYADGRLAGQAFIDWTCRCCEQAQPAHHNTAVPSVCLPCAQKFKLCQECGADVHLRIRRAQAIPES